LSEEPGVNVVTAAGDEHAHAKPESPMSDLERVVREISISREEETSGPAGDKGDHEQSIEASFK
jgi:hypothetical protein